MPHVFEKRVKINKSLYVFEMCHAIIFHIYRRMIKDFYFYFWFIAEFG
jgi:hypothetical protein